MAKPRQRKVPASAARAARRVELSGDGGGGKKPSPAATASDSPTGRVKNLRELVQVTIAGGQTVPVWSVDVGGIAVLLAGEVWHYAIGEYHGDEQAVRLIKQARDEGAVDGVHAWEEFLRRHYARDDVTAETPAADPADHGPIQPIEHPGAVMVPVAQIHRRPSNRGGEPVKPKDVAGLMDSIAAFGLSRPIEVRDSSNEQALQADHYELIKGERRLTACRALGWEQIPAIVRRGQSDRDAAVQVAIDNTNAKPLDPIEQALEIRAGVAAGLSLEEASLACGLSQAAGKDRLRMLQLSPKLQQAIRKGQLPARDARYLVPYAGVPAVVKICEQRLQRRHPFFVWPERERQREILSIVQPAIRFVDGKRENDLGWQKGRHKCHFAKDVRDDPELRKQLGVVEIRLGNKPVEVATNTKLFDARNEKAAKEKAEKEKEKAKTKQQAKASGQAANPQAQAQQDRSLQEKADAWRHQFLRLGIASYLDPGDWRTEKIVLWVFQDASTTSYGSRLDLWDWIQAVAIEFGCDEDKLESFGGWATIAEALPDTDDPVREAELLRCQVAQRILWPQSPVEIPEHDLRSLLLAGPNELPERFPGLPRGDVETIAEWMATPVDGLGNPCLTRFADGWNRARDEERPERLMLAKLFGFTNKRQLRGIAEELGVWDQVGQHKKLVDQQSALLALHNTSSKLKIPALVADKKRGRRS